MKSDNIFMGVGSYASHPKLHRYNDLSCKVIIGNFCSLAEDIEFIPGGRHQIDRVTTFPIRRVLGLSGFEQDDCKSPNDVLVGNDVWICRGVKIIGDITIGDGAVLAAYSVVNKDVPPYAIVAGNPAVVKKFRFSQDIIESLINIAWWNWPIEQVIERVDDLMSADIEKFINKYKNKDI